MLVVMDLHRLRINRRLQRIVRIRQWRYGNLGHSGYSPSVDTSLRLWKSLSLRIIAAHGTDSITAGACVPHPTGARGGIRPLNTKAQRHKGHEERPDRSGGRTARPFVPL